MDEREIKAARNKATAYAREHAQELAVELLEWSDTALLRNGRVRELAQILKTLDAHHSLTLARSFAERAALEQAARRTTPDRDAIIEECAALADTMAGRGYPSNVIGRDIRALKTTPTAASREEGNG
ncbi:hypothetical protein [Burkholderia ubonensis]|uniref:hypothetical protein n=1 Tax=Burkholderia ubonensis TaxID=101571 RepID=UPI000AEF8058|nr:hypothetical protein [Burkholderia ubonensis]